MDSQIAATSEDSAGQGVELVRKDYITPTLTDFGSVNELTRGTFAGVGADNGIYS